MSEIGYNYIAWGRWVCIDCIWWQLDVSRVHTQQYVVTGMRTGLLCKRIVGCQTMAGFIPGDNLRRIAEAFLCIHSKCTFVIG